MPTFYLIPVKKKFFILLLAVQQGIVGTPTFFHRHVSCEHQLPVTFGQRHAEAVREGDAGEKVAGRTLP